MDNTFDTLISGATAGVTSAPIAGSQNPDKAFQVTLTGTGTVTATVRIQGTLVLAPAESDWVDLDTVTLSGSTGSATDLFVHVGRLGLYRAVLVSITGTGATANVYMVH